jgi:uncharacterized membrane protein
MLQLLVSSLGTGVVFVILDGAWLSLAGPRLYRPALDPLLADKPNGVAAVVFYAVYLAGIVALAVAPNRGASLARAAMSGAILGAVAYATYDLTNQATMKVWATRITLIDIGWGALVTAVGAAAGLATWRWAARF